MNLTPKFIVQTGISSMTWASCKTQYVTQISTLALENSNESITYYSLSEVIIADWQTCLTLNRIKINSKDFW